MWTRERVCHCLVDPMVMWTPRRELVNMAHDVWREVINMEWENMTTLPNLGFPK